tara:strand:+ start:3433 stop:3675 length:243 start_codon:yes stop_codon:yes gene_type:complete
VPAVAGLLGNPVRTGLDLACSAIGVVATILWQLQQLSTPVQRRVLRVSLPGVRTGPGERLVAADEQNQLPWQAPPMIRLA